MMKWLSFALILGAGCGGGASVEQCERLFHKMVSFEIGDISKLSKADKDRLDSERQKLEAFSKESFIGQCTKKTPQETVECALGAKSWEDFAKCDA